jgi:hypothetical protein
MSPTCMRIDLWTPYHLFTTAQNQRMQFVYATIDGLTALERSHAFSSRSLLYFVDTIPFHQNSMSMHLWKSGYDHLLAI